MFKKIAYLGENTEKRSNLCSFNNCSKQIISIIRGKTLKIMMIFIVWIVFIPLVQKTNFNHLKEVCQNKDFCNVIMPSEDTKILEFNQH